MVIHNEFMNIFTTKKGFTLIELIIVISIISVLAVLGMSSYQSIQQDSRNTRRKADLKELQKALEAHKSRNGIYPSTCTGGATSCANTASYWWSICDTAWSTSVVCTSTYIPGLAPAFIAVLPEDPRQNRINPSSQRVPCTENPNLNTYIYKSTGVDYKIAVHCTPEGALAANDPFYDPIRPNWAWQISSSQISLLW